MISKIKISVFALGLTLIMSSCKTSGDLASGRDQAENPEIQSIENPALSTQMSTSEPQDINKKLSMAEGELETLRAQTENEKEQLRIRISELEKQNQTLQEEMTKNTPASVIPPQNQQAGAKDPKNTPAVEESEALWNAALEHHKNAAHDKVLSTLETLFSNHPKNKVQLESLILMGLTQYKTQAYNDAAITFNSVIDKFPKRKEVALAWFGQACAFAKLKQSDSSQLIFGELLKRYPKSTEAALTKKILSKKDKIPSNLFALSSNYPALAKIE